MADRITEVLEQFAETRRKMVEELSKIIVGQRDVVDQIFAAIFTRGHCLLVGVPGLAKTLMVSSISRMLDLQFKRVQFTPDLMPSDILGTEVLEEDHGTGHRHFRFQQGPVFTNLLLADDRLADGLPQPRQLVELGGDVPFSGSRRQHQLARPQDSATFMTTRRARCSRRTWCCPRPGTACYASRSPIRSRNPCCCRARRFGHRSRPP